MTRHPIPFHHALLIACGELWLEAIAYDLPAANAQQVAKRTLEVMRR